MQRLRDDEAWIRFACALLGNTELPANEITEEANVMLREYQNQFPLEEEPKKVFRKYGQRSKSSARSRLGGQ